MLSDLTPRPEAAPVHASPRERSPGQGLSHGLLLLSTLCAGALLVFLWQARSENERLAEENTRLKSDLESASLLPAGQDEPDQPASESASTLPEPERSSPTSPAVSASATEAAFVANGYEATNLKVQQAMVVELDDGRLQKVLLEIPVLYRSRELRLNPQLAEELRRFRDSLLAHQVKMRSLRSDGALLLAQWNRFIKKSSPTQILRADSISLPENQGLSAPNRFSKPQNKPDIQPAR